MELFQIVMQWIVAPVAGVVYVMWMRQQDHHTDIAVLKSQVEANKLSSDREMKEFRETVRAIFMKLDSIEEFLRDRK
jgi:soluble cytochrome b562